MYKQCDSKMHTQKYFNHLLNEMSEKFKEKGEKRGRRKIEETS
jgi:hypothetical protein